MQIGLLGGIFGFCYLTIPLYKVFCQKMGLFGDNDQKSFKELQSKLNSVNKQRKIEVFFDSETDPRLNWKFETQQDKVTIHPGETALVFYKAENKSTKPSVGVATYSVYPENASNYFSKIQCFCFNQQLLQGKEELDLPLYFYIEPEFQEDEALQNVNTLRILYRFFPVKEQQVAEMLYQEQIRDLNQKKFILEKRLKSAEKEAQDGIEEELEILGLKLNELVNGKSVESLEDSQQFIMESQVRKAGSYWAQNITIKGVGLGRVFVGLLVFGLWVSVWIFRQGTELTQDGFSKGIFEGQKLIFSYSILCIFICHFADPGYGPFKTDSKNFCEFCKKNRPDLTSHCSICNNCVYMKLHHCFLLDNCIGYRNLVPYIYFLLSISLMAILHLVSQFYIFPQAFNNTQNYPLLLLTIETLLISTALYFTPNLTGLLRKSYKKWYLRKPIPYKTNPYKIISILRILFYDPIFYLIPLPATISTDQLLQNQP